MKPAEPRPLTPRDRDRALGLLRRISVSAGVGSLVAVGGLSYAAAASFSGKQVASTTVAAISTATPTPSATVASAATTAPTVAATPAPAAATAPPVATSGGS